MELDINPLLMELNLREKKSDFVLDNLSSISEVSDFELSLSGREDSVLMDNNNDKSELSSRIRSALENNVDHLSDQQLIKDLLPADNAFTNITESRKQEIYPSTTDHIDSLRPRSLEYFSNTANIGRYLHNSSTPKKQEVSSNYNQNAPAKRVYFAPYTEEIKTSESDAQKRLINMISDSTEFQPLASSLRTMFMGPNMENSGGNDAFQAYAELVHPLLDKLHQQTQQIRDLEEEMTLTEATISKLKCENDLVEKKLRRKDDQLNECKLRIEKLNADWQSTHRRLIMSRDSCHTQNEKMKKEIEAQKDEILCLEKDKMKFEEQMHNNLQFKDIFDKTKPELDSLRNQNREVLEENQRLNVELNRLSHKVQENEDLKSENKRLVTKVSEIEQNLQSQEEELARLRQRHEVLLQKTLLDSEVKNKAVSERENIEEVVHKMKTENLLLMDGIHLHYQKELQVRLENKKQDMLSDFEEREAKIRKENQLEVEQLKRLTSEQQMELQKRLERESLRLRDEWASKEKLHLQKLTQLQQENSMLRNQQEAIITAVSAVVPQVASNSIHSQREPTRVPYLVSPFPSHPASYTNVYDHGIQSRPRSDDVVPENVHEPPVKYDSRPKSNEPPRHLESEPIRTDSHDGHKEWLTNRHAIDKLKSIANMRNVPINEGLSKEAEEFNVLHRPEFRSRPFTTSTSLSSLSEVDATGDGVSSVGGLTIQGLKKHKSRGRRKVTNGKNRGDNGRRTEDVGRNGIDQVSTVGSGVSVGSSAPRSDFFNAVDRDIEGLVSQVNFMMEGVHRDRNELERGSKNSNGRVKKSSAEELETTQEKITNLTNLLTKFRSTSR